MNFVIVGMDSFRVGPNLALGPFDTREEADDFASLLDKTTSGRVFILPLHTPQPKSAA